MGLGNDIGFGKIGSIEGTDPDWNLVNLTDSAWTRTAVGNSAVPGQEVISGSPAYNGGATEMTYEYIAGINRRWNGGAAGSGNGDGEIWHRPLYEGGALTGTTRLRMDRNFIIQVGITEVTGFSIGGAGIQLGLCDDTLGQRILWGKYSNGHALVTVYNSTLSSGLAKATGYSVGTWPVFGQLQLSADGRSGFVQTRGERGVPAGGTQLMSNNLTIHDIITGDLNLCVGAGVVGYLGTHTTSVSFRLGWRILPQGSTYNV